MSSRSWLFLLLYVGCPACCWSGREGLSLEGGSEERHTGFYVSRWMRPGQAGTILAVMKGDQTVARVERMGLGALLLEAFRESGQRTAVLRLEARTTDEWGFVLAGAGAGVVRLCAGSCDGDWDCHEQLSEEQFTAGLESELRLAEATDDTKIQFHPWTLQSWQLALVDNWDRVCVRAPIPTVTPRLTTEIFPSSSSFQRRIFEWTAPTAVSLSAWVSASAVLNLVIEDSVAVSVSAGQVCAGSPQVCFFSTIEERWTFVVVSLAAGVTVCRAGCESSSVECQSAESRVATWGRLDVKGEGGPYAGLKVSSYAVTEDEADALFQSSYSSQCISPVSRRLSPSHTTKFAYRRSITYGDTHYLTLVNNNRSPDYLDLVLSFASGSGAFNVAIYKPYPGCAMLSIKSTASTSYNRIYSTDPAAVGCGGLQGTFTIEVKGVSGTFQYSLDLTIQCADDGSSCFCAPGFYPDTTAAACKACPVGSYECANYRTLGCMPSYFTTAVVPGVFDCHPCPSGYGMNTGTGVCVLCHATCQSCSVAGNATKCSSCFPGAALNGAAPNTCSCSPGYYQNPDAGQCAACSSSCATCNNLSVSDCLTCLPGAALIGGIAPGTCQCLLVPTALPNSCNCHATCLTCSGATSSSCTACRTNAQLLTTSPSSCSCSDGYYPSTDSSNCVVCHAQCQTCISGSEKDCKSCRLPAILAATAPSTCKCSPGYFPYPDSTNCLRCLAECATCSGPTGCLTCGVGATLTGPAPASCRCGAGYYPNPDASMCTRCSILCATCSTSVTCDSCRENAQLLQSACVCLDSFYLSSSFDCLQCGNACASCNAVACVRCYSGFLYKTECVETCPAGYEARGSQCESIELVPPVANMTVKGDNSLQVNFDKPMNFTMNSTDILVDVEDPLGRSVDVAWSAPKFLSTREILISLTFDSSYLANGTTVVLFFLFPANVTDVYLIPIQTNTFTGTLNSFGHPPQNQSDPKLLATDVAKKTSAGVKSAFSLGVATSLLSGNPLSFMLMVNQLQLLSYLSMSRMTLPRDFASTLASLNAQGVFPSIIPTDLGGIKPEEHVKNFGIDTCVFVTNILNLLLVWVLVFCAYACIFVVSNVRNQKIAEYAASLLKNLKWSVPINLWFTSYLDIGVFCLLQMQKADVSFEAAYSGFSFCIACLVSVCFALTPLLLLCFTYWNFNHISSRRDSLFNARWGQLFLEFKQSDKLLSVIWYPLFVFRRFALAVTLVLGKDSPNFVAIFNTTVSGLVEMALVESGTLLGYLCTCILLEYSNADMEATAVWFVRLAIITTASLAMARSVLSIGGFARKLLHGQRAVSSKYRLTEASNTLNCEEAFENEGIINTRMQAKSP